MLWFIIIIYWHEVSCWSLDKMSVRGTLLRVSHLNLLTFLAAPHLPLGYFSGSSWLFHNSFNLSLPCTTKKWVSMLFNNVDSWKLPWNMILNLQTWCVTWTQAKRDSLSSVYVLRVCICVSVEVIAADQRQEQWDTGEGRRTENTGEHIRDSDAEHFQHILLFKLFSEKYIYLLKLVQICKGIEPCNINVQENHINHYY